MGSFLSLKTAIEDGLSGKNEGLPTGLDRLDDFISVKKKMMITVFGSTGCHTKGTELLNFKGNYIKVEDITEGDELLGPDSTNRTVQSLIRGNGKIYTIIPNKGESFNVNEDHILHLRWRRHESIRKTDSVGKRIGTKGEFKVDYINISVKDYLNKSITFKHKWKLYRANIEFPVQDIKINPYILGVWLGDGNCNDSRITNQEVEIKEYFKDFCFNNDYEFSCKKVEKINSYTLNIKRKKGFTKTFISLLKNENLIKNKHIPHNYLHNNRENRLQLLAGLLDSDGHFNTNKNEFAITQKNKVLAENIVFLARSLGFYVSIKENIATLKREGKKNYTCLVYKIGIYGDDLTQIPTKVKRKKALKIKTGPLSCTSTGFKIKYLGIDDYYGFELDKDNLYCLKDFIITHNSAKTTLVNQAFVMSPWEYCIKNGIPIKIIVFSMERSVIFTHAKQFVAKLFKDKGLLIDLPVLLGWYKNKKLSPKEADLIDEYESYFDRMDENIDVYEGQKTPEEMQEIIEKYAEANGDYIDIKGKVKYVPNNPQEYVLIISDHLGLTKKGKRKSKKEAIDDYIEYQQEFRDMNGYTFINVSQVNRDLSKGGRDVFEPHLDHLKESGNIAEASDLVLSIFDPIRFNTQDINYGDVSKFRCPNTGHKFFRNIGILKNSYGIDGASIGTVFMGQTGILKTLPKAKELNETWESYNYQQIFDYTYFK